VDPLEGAPLHTISLLACSASSVVVTSVAMDIGRDLISRGAAICSSTKALLPNAAHRGKLDAVEYLIKDVGSDPNVVWRQGMTPLILAARAGKTDVVHLLLTFDTLDLDIVDNSGKTAFDYAVANGRNEIVTLLAERKLHPPSHGEH
jgi:ankyrin repeat protein